VAMLDARPWRAEGSNIFKNNITICTSCFLISLDVNTMFDGFPGCQHNCCHRWDYVGIIFFSALPWVCGAATVSANIGPSEAKCMEFPLAPSTKNQKYK
jgi:hypothetical protein